MAVNDQRVASCADVTRINNVSFDPDSLHHVIIGNRRDFKIDADASIPHSDKIIQDIDIGHVGGGAIAYAGGNIEECVIADNLILAIPGIEIDGVGVGEI